MTSPVSIPKITEVPDNDSKVMTIGNSTTINLNLVDRRTLDWKLFIHTNIPELNPLMNEIENQKLKFMLKTPEVITLIRPYEQIMETICHKIINNELLMFEMSSSFINNRTQKDYTNLARNIRVLIFLLKSSIDMVTMESIPNLKGLIRTLKKTLLKNGNMNLGSIVESMKLKIIFVNELPDHWLDKIMTYMEVVLEEIDTLDSNYKSAVHLLLKILSTIMTKL